MINTYTANQTMLVKLLYKRHEGKWESCHRKSELHCGWPVTVSVLADGLCEQKKMGNSSSEKPFALPIKSSLRKHLIDP